MAAPIVPVAKVLGVTAAGILSGLGLSYNIVNMPIILKTAPNDLIAKQWHEQYKVGAAVAPPFAIVCSLCFGFLASQSTKLPGLFPDLTFDPTTPFALYTAAAIAVPSIVPWTLTQMSATNDRLMEKAEKTEAFGFEEAKQLIGKWVALNWVRVGLMITGTVLGGAANIMSS